MATSGTTGHAGRPGQHIPGQLNTGASTDPNTLRSDAGSVNPLSVYSFGGDWTPTAKLVVSARYGYFFNNNEQRGTPVGTRYVYQQQRQRDHHGSGRRAVCPSSLFNTSGFRQHPEQPGHCVRRLQAQELQRAMPPTSSATWAAPTPSRAATSTRPQSNDVLRTFNGGAVNLFLGSQSYTPVTSTTACDAIKASNLRNFGKSACQGRYGYFVVGTGVVNTGGSSQTARRSTSRMPGRWDTA